MIADISKTASNLDAQPQKEGDDRGGSPGLESLQLQDLEMVEGDLGGNKRGAGEVVVGNIGALKVLVAHTLVECYIT